MSFTKRDYEAVARIIRTHLCVADQMAQPSPPIYAAACRNIGVALSEHFAATNPAFDPDRFARSCEPKGGQ